MGRRRLSDDEKREDEDEEQGIWGTWEELVLACAVSRHGTGRWDSVAAEVGSRAAPPRHHLLTPQRCRKRYRELKRRFNEGGRGGGNGEEDDDDDDGGCGAGCGVTVPWLEDLRRLRVAELRREVERYDDSIVSLQLKVKKLTEERERSLESAEPASRGTNPGAIRGSESARSPLPVKDEEHSDGGRHGDDVRQPDPTAEGKGQHPGEGSCDGSSDTVAKDGDGGPTKLLADTAAPHPETISAAAESSDVQSSASQASVRRERGGSRKPPGSSVAALSSSSPASSGGGGGGGIHEELSRPRSSRPLAEGTQEEDGRGSAGGEAVTGSPRLVSVLEVVRSHKYGSVFTRRLPAQKTAGYRSLIRQHIDLDSIHRRLDDPAYSAEELFRDLLLLCANASVFFPRSSDEHAAALALRAVVAKELARRDQTSNHSAATSYGAKLAVPKQEHSAAAAEPDLPAFLEKPPSALVACRKRSTVASGKPNGVVKAAEVRKKQPDDDDDNDEDDDAKVEKEIQKEPVLEDKLVDKPFKRGLRTTKARGAAVVPKAPLAAVAAAMKAEVPESQPAKGDGNVCTTSSPSMPPVVAKKRSAAGFLKRLKGGTTRSPSPADQPTQTTLNPPRVATAVTPKASKGEGPAITADHHKKGPAMENDKDAAAAAPPTQEEEPDTQPKRKGRPPKRKAAPPPTPPAKRARAVDPATTPLARLRGGYRKRD